MKRRMLYAWFQTVRRYMKRLFHGMIRKGRIYWPGIRFSLPPPGDHAASVIRPATSLYPLDKTGFVWEGADFPLNAGWYLLYAFDSGSPDERANVSRLLRLCVDYSEKCFPNETLLFGADRIQTCKVVLLAGQACRLRRVLNLAPTISEFRITTLNIRLRRIGRPEAAWRMWRTVRDDAIDAEVSVPLLRGKAWAHLKSDRHRFALWLHQQYRRTHQPGSYETWLKLYDPGYVQPRQVDRPLVSIVLPVYNTPVKWLRRCLDSVRAQTWQHWELCVADDASTEPATRDLLRTYAALDVRIRITWRSCNGGIPVASNSALAMARGTFVALLDHDDELHPSALTLVMEAWANHPSWRVVYTDEDKIDQAGLRFDPYFKPDWNYDLLLGHNFLAHLIIYQRNLLLEVGGFREGLEGAQDWDLVLRCSERLKPEQIGHIPRVLYHWRAVKGSAASDTKFKPYAHSAAKRALSEHLRRCYKEQQVEVMHINACQFRIRRVLPLSPPGVSIVIPTRDQGALLRQCVQSILQRSTYPGYYDIVLVDNRSSEVETLNILRDYAQHPRIRVLKVDKPFNYSHLNNTAVAFCQSDLICLLNNDTEIITPDWLEELVSHARRVSVGAVGAMLYYPNDTIQHAGIILGSGGIAGHVHWGQPRGFIGPNNRARMTQSMSAVTGACLMVRRALYQQVSGLDENLTVAFNDLDFCLRLRQCGYTNVWTPFAELYHHESVSRGYEDTPEKQQRFKSECDYMLERWGDDLVHDPCYNPNLSLAGAGELFTLAFPPRA